MRTLLATALPLLVLLAGCSSPSDGDGDPTTTNSSTDTGTPNSLLVELYDDYFEDGNKTVENGTAIRYVNEGQRPHTVTIHWVGDSPTTFRENETLQPGQDVTYTFDRAGTYHVFCRFHGTMTGGMHSVVVAA